MSRAAWSPRRRWSCPRRPQGIRGLPQGRCGGRCSRRSGRAHLRCPLLRAVSCEAMPAPPLLRALRDLPSRSAAAPTPSAGSWRRILFQLLTPGLARARARRSRVSFPGTPQALSLSVGPVERQDQLSAQVLAQRMRGDQRFDLADELRSRPVSRSASIRRSRVVSRSSSRRAMSVCRPGSAARSASAGPRQSCSASASFAERSRGRQHGHASRTASSRRFAAAPGQRRRRG